VKSDPGVLGYDTAGSNYQLPKNPYPHIDLRCGYYNSLVRKCDFAVKFQVLVEKTAKDFIEIEDPPSFFRCTALISCQSAFFQLGSSLKTSLMLLLKVQ